MLMKRTSLPETLDGATRLTTDDTLTVTVWLLAGLLERWNRGPLPLLVAAAGVVLIPTMWWVVLFLPGSWLFLLSLAVLCSMTCIPAMAFVVIYVQLTGVRGDVFYVSEEYTALLSIREKQVHRSGRRRGPRELVWNFSNHAVAFPGKKQGRRFREQIVDDLLANAHEVGAQIKATAANQKVANLYVEQFPFLEECGRTWRQGVRLACRDHDQSLGSDVSTENP